MSPPLCGLRAGHHRHTSSRCDALTHIWPTQAECQAIELGVNSEGFRRSTRREPGRCELQGSVPPGEVTSGADSTYSAGAVLRWHYQDAARLKTFWARGAGRAGDSSPRSHRLPATSRPTAAGKYLADHGVKRGLNSYAAARNHEVMVAAHWNVRLRNNWPARGASRACFPRRADVDLRCQRAVRERACR